MKMKAAVREAKKKESLVVLVSIAGLAAAYLAWQLIGLRYTNHDDIYFHLCSQIFSGDYIEYARSVAQKQARLQAYINVPVILWVYSLANSVTFDLLNIGVFGLVYIGFGWLLACISGARNSLIIIAITLLLFPLHYYFTFPQGYPVMAEWGLAFVLISAALLDSHLRRPSVSKQIISAILFSLSLWGPEYNFILHPALLLVVFLSRGNFDLRLSLKKAWPHLVGWVASGVLYILYSMISREAGADAYGRVSIGFDVLAMARTFFVLQTKALLPLALWDGIRLVSAATQGSPQTPSLLNYFSLWHGARDAMSVAIVFILTFSIAAVGLCRQRLTRRQTLLCTILFLLLGVVPCLVLAASSHYQLIVLKGYLQGHLASFYSQLGFSGILFVLCAYLCNVSSGRFFGPAVVFISAAMLAAVATVTFVYNNVNRQVMAANQQKWLAMKELVDFVKSNRPDLLGGVIAAPDFWSLSGVSAIPEGNMPDGLNYWTSYARNALRASLEFSRSGNRARVGYVEAKYFANPSGDPISILLERAAEGWRITMVAARPVGGSISYQYGKDSLKDVSLAGWKCADICVKSLIVPETLSLDSFSFHPARRGPRRLIGQFLLAREGAFAFPLATTRGDVSGAGGLEGLRVVDWGPKATAIGVVPNRQSDGSAGIWVKIDGPSDLSGLQVMVDGNEATSTSVGKGLITASMPAAYFFQAGGQMITIRQISTGKSLDVGQLVVSEK